MAACDAALSVEASFYRALAASLSAASALVTLVTACPDSSVRSINHDASPTLTISRVACLTPA